MDSAIILHGLSPEDLERIIMQVVKNQLEEFRKDISIDNTDDLLTRTEACSLLKITMTTLWNWSKKGRIISYGIGNRVYYKKSELLDSLVKLR